MIQYPPGTRFNPKDRVLVSRYLYKVVKKKQSSFITTMDVYKDEPWLLDHVTNPLFNMRQWYYFVPRTNLHGNVARRTVPGRGDSEGGFWKSTDKKKKILNRNNRVIGYKQCLSYQKKVQGKPVNTDWTMTEYSLPKGEVFQDLVLCWMRQKKENEIENNHAHGIVHHVPQPQPQPQVQAQAHQAQAQVVENTNNILSNPVQEEAELNAEELEEMLLEGQEKADEELREFQEMLLQDDEELREFEENTNDNLCFTFEYMSKFLGGDNDQQQN